MANRVSPHPIFYRCRKCHFFSTKYLLLLAHIRDAHSWESNFRVVCGIEGCPKTYTVVDSLKKHVYREHGSVIGGSSSTVPHGRTFCEAESGEQPTSDGDVDDPAPASTVTDDVT
ncbi:hypothetical protein HPB49_010786 [Dermacentor silvarum]|uniref:Uncharacterized protein n=1 Tax=Dermacentor silvarum TaxID=543639 RepID=A0ACB8DNY4_DERSI|nr:hypothetical protein HPB49_010786 [Dermacentor silvarum]